MPAVRLAATMRTALLVAVLALAGCATPAALTETSTPAAVDWHATGSSLWVEHDHADRELHTDLAQGLRVLAASTLSPDNVSLGEYAEADHANGLVAVTSAIASGAHFALLDAEALPAVRVLSVTWDAGAYGDVKLDRHEPLLYHAHPGSELGFTIWDVSDPAAPVPAGAARGPGCHMLHPQRLGGVPHVWCASLPSALLYRLEEIRDGAWTAVPVAAALPQGDPEVARYGSYYERILPAPALGYALLTVPHDMTAQDDPLTGAPVVAVASELQGVRVFDVAVPSAPREISRWRGEGLDGEMHRIHTALLHKVGDRRLAFLATETFHDVPPQVYIVDMTDWDAPAHLATWTPPGIEDDGGILYSAHNLNAVGDRLYVANFHGGMWVLDVGDPAAPEVLAHRMPVRDTGYPEKGKMLLEGVPLDANSVWDVVVVRGHAILTDMPAGIEVLAVDGDPHGDAAHASVG